MKEEIIEEISKKVNCKECDPRLCNNNYLNCIKIKKNQKKGIGPKLCLECKFLDNEIVEGYLKCYHTCPYRKDKKKGLEKWL